MKKPILKRMTVPGGDKHFLLSQIMGSLILSGLLYSGQTYAGALNIPNYPLLGSGTTDPANVLILYDNSVSMESELNGGFVGGSDPNSRSNVARISLRSVLNNYHSKFNWGIETFQTSGGGLNGVFEGYHGDSATMVPTNDCVGGISHSHGGLRCVPNPEFSGYGYITYADDYGWTTDDYNKGWYWGVTSAEGPSGFDYFYHHNPAVTTWSVSNDNSTFYDANNDFKDPDGANPIVGGPCGYWAGFDAGAGSGGGGGGYCPPPTGREFWRKYDWLFLQNPNGRGKIVEVVKQDSPSHLADLLGAVATETPNLSAQDIKNGSEETPLAGSFITAGQYFSGALSGFSSPIQSACQQNYVLMATDGQPTMDEYGSLYSSTEMNNATSGRAYTDLYPKIRNLRSLVFGGNTYDIQTYVLGMGEITSNPVAVDGLNKMAKTGGTDQAYLAHDSASMMYAFQNIVNNMGVHIPLRQSNGHIILSVAPNMQNTYIYKAAFANPSSDIWEGNIIKSKPQMTSSGSSVSYDTGSITGFNTGAAQWLTNNTVNGHARQIIVGTQTKSTSAITGASFQWASLNGYTRNLLINSGESVAQGNLRLDYLRGDRSNEASYTNPTGFRSRGQTVLGDIIDSSPVYVGPSLSGFSDADFPDGTPSFNAFAQGVVGRRPMVYVGANDGMLHGFAADTLQEVFAFVPNSVVSKMKLLSDQSYAHEFYVNETPVVTDIMVPGRGWTTELIGFPGIGGTGLFALDVTSPDGRRASTDLASAEKHAGNILLWELNSNVDPDIGYILNRGQIDRNRGGMSVQIGKMSNKRWAIITGNGYNSPNNSTGLLVTYLDASGGTPSYKKVMISGVTGGLSTPTPVDIDLDGIVDYAYAGDLQGNVWRFDLRGDETKWKAFKLFQAVAGSPAKISPITVAPAVMFHCAKPGLMVFVGTGKYIESADSQASYADNHVDYLFGLWDKLDTSAISKGDLVIQSYLYGSFKNSSSSPDVAQSLLLTTDNTVNWSSGKRGWMLQLYNQYPQPARIIVPPYVVDGILYFNTISPNAGACQANASMGTSQALQACSGQRPQTGVFDTNYDGQVNNDDQYDLSGTRINVTGINTKDLGRIIDSSTVINPKAFTCSGSACNAVKTGFNDLIGVKMPDTPEHRLSWKEIRQRR